MTVKQIAETYEVHPATVRAWARKAGLTIRHGYPWADFTDDEVALIGSQQKLPRRKRRKHDVR